MKYISMSKDWHRSHSCLRTWLEKHGCDMVMHCHLVLGIWAHIWNQELVSAITLSTLAIWFIIMCMHVVMSSTKYNKWINVTNYLQWISSPPNVCHSVAAMKYNFSLSPMVTPCIHCWNYGLQLFPYCILLCLLRRPLWLKPMVWPICTPTLASWGICNNCIPELEVHLESRIKEVPDQRGRNTITNLGMPHWLYEYDGKVLVTEQRRSIKQHKKNAACWKHSTSEE